MYDDIAILKEYTDETYDKYGNRTVTIKETTVYVQPRGVYSSEFYQAAQAGLKPSLTLVIANREDYADQPVVEFHGKDYSVIRVDWDAQRDRIALICEERVNSGERDSSDGEYSE